MKNSYIVAFIFLSTAFSACAGIKPTKSTVPLSADEVAIYRSALQEYVGKSGSLNVSIETYPLDPDFERNGLKEGSCLKGIQLGNLSTVAHTYHILAGELLGKNMRLVDPHRQATTVRQNDPRNSVTSPRSVHSAVNWAFNAALFSLSEIAFDKDHRHAVVAYRFWCGSLCGNGSTLVFEKVGDRWRKTNHDCGGWIS